MRKPFVSVRLYFFSLRLFVESYRLHLMLSLNNYSFFSRKTLYQERKIVRENVVCYRIEKEKGTSLFFRGNYTASTADFPQK